MDKPNLTIILSRLKKPKEQSFKSKLDEALKSSKSSDRAEEENDLSSSDLAPMEIAASDLLKAIEAKSAHGVAEAFRDLHDLSCDACMSGVDDEDSYLTDKPDTEGLLGLEDEN